MESMGSRAFYPYLPASLPLPFPFSPSTLEVGPLRPARGFEERCKLPQRPQTHLLAILSVENASGGNRTVLSVHLLGQSST